MFSIRRSEHLCYEDVLARVPVEHVDGDACVQGSDLVPEEGWNEEHLSWLQDTVLTLGISEQGELVQVWGITAHLALHSLTMGTKGVGVEGIKISTEQAHLFPSLNHHQEVIIRVKVAELVVTLQSNPHVRPQVQLAIVPQVDG